VRQGQQNRRGRGRNNNNRGKGHHNPLSRSFESNGPAERIRGTPAHIAEKYLSLARDAQSTGDSVLAENYLQHAEHYNRIIMAYRDQFNQPHEAGMNGGGHRGMRGPGDMGGESFDDTDDDMAGDDGFPQPFAAPQPQSHPPQPRPHEPRHHQGGEPGRPERAERPDRGDRPERHDRPDRPFRRDREQRPPRFGDRDRGDRGERQGFVDRDRQPEARIESRPEPRAEPRSEAPPERPSEQVAESTGGEAREPRRRGGDRFQQPHEQPEFLRRPVRRVRNAAAETGNSEAPGKTESSGE
jgi:hypothetical protein